MFGIDEGATVGFEYRFAVIRHVQAAAYRTGFDRTIQLYGKYDAFHQSASMPFGLSGLVSVEGTNNFQEHYAPAIGASISREVFNVAAVYAVPMWVHNTAAATGETRDTGMIGIGGSVRVTANLYIIGEVTPRIGGYVIGDAEYGFGASVRVGGHVFDLTFTNTTRERRSRKSPAAAFPAACISASTWHESSTNRIQEQYETRLARSGSRNVAVACDDSTTAPASTNPTFTAQLLPANETTAIVGGETSSGTVTITFVTTKDAAGNVTSASMPRPSSPCRVPGRFDDYQFTHSHRRGGSRRWVLVPFRQAR